MMNLKKRAVAALLVLSAAQACSSSKSSPTTPFPLIPTAQSQILSLDAVTPAGPAEVISGRDPVTLTFTIDCQPPSGSECHVGFDFLTENGTRVQRGCSSCGFGRIVGPGRHTVQAAGAPAAGFTGITVGVRAVLSRDTTGQELGAAEFRATNLRYTWITQ